VIDALKGIFASTQGYAAMWPTLAVPVLAAVPLLVPLRKAERHA
jgi:hypothetical protein